MSRSRKARAKSERMRAVELAQGGLSLKRSLMEALSPPISATENAPAATSRMPLDNGASVGEETLKRSAVLLKLAEPLFAEHRDYRERWPIIMASTIAFWNKAMLPEQAQVIAQAEIISKFEPQEGQGVNVAAILGMMEQVEERRKQLFSDLRFWVQSYDFQIVERDATLVVVASEFPSMRYFQGGQIAHNWPEVWVLPNAQLVSEWNKNPRTVVFWF